MPKKYEVALTDEQRGELQARLQQGGLSFRQHRRVRTLLLADEGETDADIAAELDSHTSSIERTRQRFAQQGLEAALGEGPRPGRPPLLDGQGEALVVALACTEAPAGQARWTLRQLAERVVGLEVVEQISPQTVQRVLKKTPSSLGRSSRGACRR